MILLSRHSMCIALVALLLNMSFVHCGELTDRDILYQDIFSNYSMKTLPVLNHTDRAAIGFESQIININNFDEISGELSITVSFTMVWREERLTWNPTGYGHIDAITVQPGDIWRPQMFLSESADIVTDLISRASFKPRLFYNGTVIYAAGDVLRVTCPLNVALFPFDEQKCVMRFFDFDVSEADIVFYPVQSDLQMMFFKTNSQWSVTSGKLQNCTEFRQPCINLTINLKRRSDFYVIYIFVPIIFLSVINNLVFLMPPSSGERTSVAVTTFLSFIVYMDIVNDVVPQSSDPVSRIYYYLTALMIYSCTILFLCIVSLKIYDQTTQVPNRLKTAVWYLRLNFVSLKSSKVKVEDLSTKQQTKKIVTETNLEHTSDVSAGDNEKRMMKELYDERGETAKGSMDRSFEKQMTKELYGERERMAKGWMDMSVESITWDIVGKTFDIYCFIFLYLFIVIYTLANVMVPAST